jgi:hypothetical protein
MGKIVWAYCNLRYDPSISSSIIERVYNGDQVNLYCDDGWWSKTPQIKEGTDGGDWVFVQVVGTMARGYVTYECVKCK